MKKTFSAVMIIIGTVIGSGFASGKEIAVYFSRFGSASYFFIALTFFLFFGLIYSFFSFGERALDKLASSKLFSVICIIISLIFTASMFAGTINVLPENIFVRIAFGAALIGVCCYVARRGIPFLSKLNNFLIPLTLVSMLVVLLSNFSLPKAGLAGQNAFAGLFFTLLYSVLNFSMSSIVIAKSGIGMSKKEKVWASLISSLTLCSFLLLTNFVLLSHPESMQEAMPLVFIASGVCGHLIRFVVFSGCITTLFSLVFTTSESLKKLGCKGWGIYLIAIFFPCICSLFGFGTIVSFLYPFASVLGIFLLLILFFLPSRAADSS